MELHEILELHLLSDYSGKDMESHLEEVNKIIGHTHRVLKICEAFAVNLKLEGTELELLKAAAILHDIAKLDEKNGEHNRLVEEAMMDMGIVQFADGKEDKVYEIIEAHKGGFNPSSDIALEAAILRMADKLDKFVKRPTKAEKSCKDSYCKILNYFATKGIALPQKFIDTYEVIMDKLK
ncbi:MAG: HD domain-containing protein [Clostridia bacterium]|nr:HD domain-containing protein [Clostridia bacterium]